MRIDRLAGRTYSTMPNNAAADPVRIRADTIHSRSSRFRTVLSTRKNSQMLRMSSTKWRNRFVVRFPKDRPTTNETQARTMNTSTGAPSCEVTKPLTFFRATWNSQEKSRMTRTRSMKVGENPTFGRGMAANGRRQIRPIRAR